MGGFWQTQSLAQRGLELGRLLPRSQGLQARPLHRVRGWGVTLWLGGFWQTQPLAHRGLELGELLPWSQGKGLWNWLGQEPWFRLQPRPRLWLEQGELRLWPMGKGGSLQG